MFNVFNNGVFYLFFLYFTQVTLKYLKLDGQGKARREAARRRNSECKINFSSQNSSRSNGSRPTAVQRAVIGRRRSALVANRQRRRVRSRLNMSVINTGGGAHWTGGRRGAALRTLLAICGPFPMSRPQSFGVKSGIFSKVECNKSEWKGNLGIRNSSRSNRSWRMTTYTVS